MKKLINAPDDRGRRCASRAWPPRTPSLRLDAENKVVIRGDAPRPGKVGLVSGGGSGHEPLHGGFVGYGMLDAACAGRGVHLAGARPDARRDPGRQRRRRRAAHREELHRRRAQLPDGRRARRRRGHRGRLGGGQRRRGGPGLACTRPAGAASARTVFVEKIAGAAGRGGRAAGRRRRDRPRGQRAVPLASASRSPRARVPAAGKPDLRAGRTTRSSSASASTASPAGSGRTLHQRERSWPTRAGRDRRRHAAVRRPVLVMVNGMGGTPLMELYVAVRRGRSATSTGRASGSPGRWSATTSPAWTCRASR